MFMRAAVLSKPGKITQRPLHLESVPRPEPAKGEVLLRVLACGVCRTDLHIVEGELPPQHPRLIPGHQIVGEVEDIADGAVEQLSSPLQPGSRVGVSWIGGTDGRCWYCRHGMENLCDTPTFTGYTVNGGYAEFATARADFVFPLPQVRRRTTPAAGSDEPMDALQAAPLLCAGIIGFRSLRVAGVQPGEHVGLFGFGASAHLAIDVLRHWGCAVYVSTRGASHRKLAEDMGADWVGSETERPPVQLDRAVTFAPSGDVVVSALACLRKGGVVAINAIHLDRMPQFDYDRLLWGERQLRSVTNMTRDDARDFLSLAAEIGIRPKVTSFSLDEANQALAAIKQDAIDGAALIVP